MELVVKELHAVSSGQEAADNEKIAAMFDEFERRWTTARPVVAERSPQAAASLDERVALLSWWSRSIFWCVACDTQDKDLVTRDDLQLWFQRVPAKLLEEARTEDDCRGAALTAIPDLAYPKCHAAIGSGAMLRVLADLRSVM